MHITLDKNKIIIFFQDECVLLCGCYDYVSLMYNEFDYWFDGLPSSRPKVILAETRVMLPEIYSHVARYLESCRPKFHNAQKDSKNANAVK